MKKKYDRDAGGCCVPGCTAKAAAGARLCVVHKHRKQAWGDVNAPSHQTGCQPIAPEVLAEYERRIRRLEDPVKVARDLGYSLQGLRGALARRQKSDRSES